MKPYVAIRKGNRGRFPPGGAHGSTKNRVLEELREIEETRELDEYLENKDGGSQQPPGRTKERPGKTD